MPGTGEFDESKHPRAPNGKFGAGSVHSEENSAARVERALNEASRNRRIDAKIEIANKHGASVSDVTDAHLPASVHAEAKTKGEEAAQAERADIENEKAELAAGHITELPSKAFDAHEAASETIAADVAATGRDLDAAHLEASKALAHVESLHVEGIHDDIDSLHEHTGELRASFDEVSSALGNESSEFENIQHEYKDGEYNPEDHDLEGTEFEPKEFESKDFDRKEFEPNENVSDADNDAAEAKHEAEQDRAEAQHEKDQRIAERTHDATQKAAEAEHDQTHEVKLDRHRAEVVARLHDAQDSLERLHEAQTAAAAKLTASEKAYDKVRSKADEELDTDPADMVTIPEDHEGYDKALEAATSLAGHQSTTRSEALGAPVDFASVRDALKDSTKITANAIKRIAKITGRAPKLAGRAKKSNRPGSGTQASVASMARYKLKLSKLDFVSLVDQPAQATATCRLIKRAGGKAQIQAKATAQLLKVADGPNPLAYFWAFTCTGEDGQPYHDLQGDAIEPSAYIKAAEDFMSGGGAVDEMHDSRQTGRVAFAFPMDSDIAKAMFGDAAGGLIKTSGLMVAMRPTADQVAKLRSGELTGVSIAGNGIRELAKRMPAFLAGKDKKKPKRYGKSVTLTSETDGHAHTIDLDAPADNCWSDMLSTSYQTSTGATESHSHAWVYDATTGEVTIAADSGHTHTVDGVVSAETMAEAAEEEDDEDDAMSSCAPAAVEDSKSGPTVVVVSARAPNVVKAAPKFARGDRVEATVNHMPGMKGMTGKVSIANEGTPPYYAVKFDDQDAMPGVHKWLTEDEVTGAASPVAMRAPVSTPGAATGTVKGTSQETKNMDPKFAKMIASALLLPEAQRAHVAKLATTDIPALQAFMSCDAADREATTLAALAADPVVYTTKSGSAIRKSHGELAKSQAEQLDRQQDQIAAQTEALAISKAKTEAVELEKSAALLIPNIGKSAAVRVALLKGVNAITDETLRTEIVEALKGANAAFATLTKSQGITGDNADPNAASDPKSIFTAALGTFAKSVSKSDVQATGDFLRTPRGAELYAEAYPTRH